MYLSRALFLPPPPRLFYSLPLCLYKKSFPLFIIMKISAHYDLKIILKPAVRERGNLRAIFKIKIHRTETTLGPKGYPSVEWR